MEEKKPVYKVSRSYKKYIRKLGELKNSMDRAQRELEIREAAFAEGFKQGFEEGREQVRQYIRDLLNQCLTTEEMIKCLS